MKTITCKELAEGLGCNYVIASGLINLLVKSGQAKVVDKVFHESGKGKPTRIYSIHNQVKIKIPTVQPRPVYKKIPIYKVVGHKLVKTKSYKKAV
jgi:hypothetical protein